MAIERTAPLDIKGVDVIRCRIKLWELSAPSLDSTARSASRSSPFLTLAGFCSPCALNSGSQGDILTVIRRLDEHWIEAKSGDKVGVCPLQFTEVSWSAPSGGGGFSPPSLPFTCGSSTDAWTWTIDVDAPPDCRLKVLIGLKMWPLCRGVLKRSAELRGAAASHPSVWDSLRFGGLTVICLCTFWELTSLKSDGKKNVTLPAAGVNVPAYSALVYLL